MSDMPDHDLDELFQEASRGIRPEFDSQDWEDLKRRLDENDRNALLKKATGYGIAILVLLSSLVWLYRAQQPAAFQTETKNHIAPTPIAPRSASKDIDRHNAITKIESNSDTPYAQQSQRSAITEKDSTAEKQFHKERNEQAIASDTHVSNHQTPRPLAHPSALALKDKAIVQDQQKKGTGHLPKRPVADGIEQNTNNVPQASSQIRHPATTRPGTKPDNKNAPTPTDMGKGGETTHTLESATPDTPIDRDLSQDSATLYNTKDDNKNQQHRKPDEPVAAPPTAEFSATSVVPKADRLPHKVEVQPMPLADSARAIKGSNNEDLPNKKIPLVVSSHAESDSAGMPSHGQQNDATKGIAARVKDSNTGITTQKDSVLLKPDSTRKETERPITAADEKDNAAEKQDTTRSHWFVKLPISPDLSSIDYNKPGKIGINAGLMVAFMPHHRWSFSTGAIWSRKLYTSDNPKKSYGSGPYAAPASFLDGECRVLDIPMNITYYVRPTARTRFFITTGVSSYIMLREKYQYTVEVNYKEYYYSEDYKGKNNDWFSMLNLSVGIQHQIAKRFFLQAEPFLKAPIAGVGQGKVNLVSMGSFFTLKYQLK